jgi:hypothetical protein
MDVKWIIEDDAFPEDTQPTIDALKSNNIDYQVVKYLPFHNINFVDLDYQKEDCVIFYGSLITAQKLRKQSRWIPGVYYNKDSYDCINYYARLGKHLLNRNYVMLPFGELKRRKEFLYDAVGEDRTVFIRPNRGDKLFTGQLVYKEYFEEDISRFGYNNIAIDEIVVVSKPYNLLYEWRLVVADNKIITGSQYRENNRVSSSERVPEEVIEFANDIVKLYNPNDRVWILDICQEKNKTYHIMEVGCFSCAGLYYCDRDIIVKEVSRIALEEWKSFQE